MSLQVEKLEHNMAKLTIEVSAEDVEKALRTPGCISERAQQDQPAGIPQGQGAAPDDREDVRTGSVL